MAQTLLQTVQNACAEMALPVPSVVATSTDPQVKQLYALMTAHGRELVRKYPWQALNTEYTFSSVATTLTGTLTSGSAIVTGLSDTSALSRKFACTGTGVPTISYVSSVDSSTQVTLTQPATISGSQSLTFTQFRYDLPSDWSKISPQTEWDRTNRWPLLGPKSAQEWAYLRGGIVSAGPRVRFRIKGNYFEVFPYPGDGYRWSFEYVSSRWVITASGGTADKFSADTDTCQFDDRLMELGLILQFRKAKGFDTAANQDAYNAHLAGCMGQDQDAPTLAMARRQTPMLLNVNSIPETGYGS